MIIFVSRRPYKFILAYQVQILLRCYITGKRHLESAKAPLYVQMLWLLVSLGTFAKENLGG